MIEVHYGRYVYFYKVYGVEPMNEEEKQAALKQLKDYVERYH
jgi:hydrogenase maturation factor